MVAHARRLQARVLPQGWLDGLRQLSLFLAAYFGYRLVRGLVEGRATAAFQHARELISIERTLHLFVEPSVQAWASGSHVVMVVTSWLYVNAQTSITTFNFAGARACTAVQPPRARATQPCPLASAQ